VRDIQLGCPGPGDSGFTVPGDTLVHGDGEEGDVSPAGEERVQEEEERPRILPARERNGDRVTGRDPPVLPDRPLGLRLEVSEKVVPAEVKT